MLMRWSRLTGFSLFLIATQAMIGCGDDDDAVKGNTAGNGGTTAGTGGKSTAGTGGKSTAGSAGAFVQGGDAGKAGSGGTDAGTAGMGPEPDCTEATAETDCIDDGNPCTTATCSAEGKCVHENNTDVCDDGNECTSEDKCDAGACKGTNNTADCDDASACTPGQDKCAEGVCSGTKDLVLCPACNVPDNIIKNCDFSMDLTSWATGITFDGGGATQTVINERDVIEIFGLGTAIYSIQPRQEPIVLKSGMKYKFRMLAGSSVDRNITVSFTKAEAPYAGYTQGTSIRVGHDFALTKDMKPYEFDFRMFGAIANTEGAVPDGDEPNAKLEIKAGKFADDVIETPHTVYFDDVYLVEEKCTGDGECDDDNACTTDACDLPTGVCKWTKLAEHTACTDDEESCTVDECVANVCVHTPLADAEDCASDDDDCTIDACSAGVCGHAFDNNVCDCQIDAHCNDNNPCTDDTCNDGTCEAAPNTATCDDANTCTSADVCAAGVCGGTNNTDACADDDVCTVNNMCAAGACGTGTNVCFDCDTPDNLIQNCGFADGASWDGYYIDGGAGGSTITFENGLMVANINNPGGAVWQVQPLQGGIVLTQGVIYTITFNAYSTIAKNLIVSITKNGGDFISYSGPQTFPLTTEMGVFTFDFEMVAPAPAENIKLEFDLGGAENNPTVPNKVFIDNVSIVPK
jgi:hypothetical protein